MCLVPIASPPHPSHSHSHHALPAPPPILLLPPRRAGRPRAHRLPGGETHRAKIADCARTINGICILQFSIQKPLALVLYLFAFRGSLRRYEYLLQCHSTENLDKDHRINLSSEYKTARFHYLRNELLAATYWE